MKMFVMIMQNVTNPYELRTGVFKTKQEAINAVLDIYKQEHDICNIYGEPGDYSVASKLYKFRLILIKDYCYEAAN